MVETLNNVTIGGKHMYKDFGLILTTKEITPPEAQTKYVDVPMRDGSIDMSEALSDEVKYKNRTITMKFTYTGARSLWSSKFTEVAEAIHGLRQKIIFDDDSGFYYMGRTTIEGWDTTGKFAVMTLTCDVEPYKYDAVSSLDDWIWDTLDFENGYINDLSGLEVNGSIDTILICRKKSTCPTFIVQGDISLLYEGNMYKLKEGSHKLYDVIVREGENKLSFSGKGTVSVDYVGGTF